VNYWQGTLNSHHPWVKRHLPFVADQIHKYPLTRIYNWCKVAYWLDTRIQPSNPVRITVSDEAITGITGNTRFAYAAVTHAVIPAQIETRWATTHDHKDLLTHKIKRLKTQRQFHERKQPRCNYDRDAYDIDAYAHTINTLDLSQDPLDILYTIQDIYTTL